MKDGRTHLAYKAEHVVDLESEILLAAEIRPADHADQQTLVDSVIEAKINLKAAGSEVEIEEVVADKGYHANATLELAADLDLADVHSRAEAEKRASLDGQAGRIQASGVQQSPPHGPRERQAVGSAAKRTRGAQLRSRVRYGRVASVLDSQAGRSNQALPDRSGGAQLSADHAAAVWNRQAAGAASPRRLCLACAICRDRDLEIG